VKHLKALTSILFLSLSGLASNADAATSLKRFEPSLSALKALVRDSGASSPAEVEQLREHFLRKDGRKYLFRIQGLTRLYRTTEAETAKPLNDKIKELEDAVGDLTAFREWAAYGRKISADPAAQAYLDKLVTQQSVLADRLLSTWFLQDAPYVDLYALGLSQLRERSDDQLIEAFKTEARAVANLEFDLGDLEDGLHELRRQMRWLNIYAEGLGDLIYVKPDTSVPDDFRRLDVTGAEWARIEIQKSFTREVSVFLTGIGNLKDQWEPVYEVEVAYVKAGIVATHAEAQSLVSARVRAANLVYPQTVEAAQRLVQDFGVQRVLNEWIRLFGN
jgi:hypothetical protein